MKTKPDENEIAINPRVRIQRSELSFHFSRSGGPGGQNVNKVSSRVTLLFDVGGSPSLSGEEKARILKGLAARVDSEGMLRIDVQESRSQWRNREEAVAKFADLLRRVLALRKKRIPTNVSASGRQKRLLGKKRHSLKKERRKGVQPE